MKQIIKSKFNDLFTPHRVTTQDLGKIAIFERVKFVWQIVEI